MLRWCCRASHYVCHCRFRYFITDEFECLCFSADKECTASWTQNKLQCEDCGKWYNSKRGYEQHRQVYHFTSEHVPTCNKCGKRFPTPSKLIYHLRSHSDARPFKCRLCGKTYKNKWNLKLHIKAHMGGRWCELDELCLVWKVSYIIYLLFCAQIPVSNKVMRCPFKSVLDIPGRVPFVRRAIYMLHGF